MPIGLSGHQCDCVHGLVHILGVTLDTGLLAYPLLP